MKKKVLAAVVLGMAMFASTGCVSGQVSNEYITISKYNGVEVDKVEGLPEITDESVEKNIQTVLEGFGQLKEIKDRPAQDGDVVVVDYTTKVDGKKVDSGSGTDYELTLGSQEMFPEFQKAVTGHKAGETFEVEHTFASTYGDKNLAGADAMITVKIKSVNEKELPELTDDFVKKISQKSKTVKEYKKEMRDLLESNNEEAEKKELIESSWNAVLKNTEVKEYPKEQLKEAKQQYYDHYQAGADMYNMSFADFVKKQLDMTEEEFEKTVTKEAKKTVKEDLVVDLIVKKEKIELSDKEYKKAKKELAKTMSYDNVKEMEKEAPEEAIRKYIMRDTVRDWVADHCVQVEK